ncbi:MAG: GTP-binding protein [Gemmataceae bacterium]|nr:GTP-binding protein [Gemmataceae bacterium]
MQTTIACLTAPGKAAIATLAVRGPQAWAITLAHFMPRKGSLPDTPDAGQYWYGRLGNELADDVVLAVKQGLPTIALEVHCHGGVEVVRMIQELYLEHGAILSPWQDETNGLFETLAHASTVRTANILLDQVSGAWQVCMRELADPDPVRGTQVRQRLAELIPLGQHLVEPWQVVIAGAPNVGKSSLMNALAGYTRSVVSPSAGTTRDTVALRLAIDGWPVEITDTAGIRAATNDLELQGIERAQSVARDADLRLWLLDGSTGPIFPDDPVGWHFLINKIDLPAAWDWQSLPEALRISARTQTGLTELCEMISRQLVPQPPLPGEAVPVTAEQAALVGKKR